MTRYRLLWLALGVVWTASLVIFWNNWQSSGDFRKYVAETETIDSYRTFLAESGHSAADAERDVATFSQEIESIDFGLLFLEEKLFWLAKENGLGDFQFAKSGEAGAEQMLQLSLTVRGSLKDFSRMLRLLEQDYPYLSLVAVETAKNSSGPGSFKLTFNYYFRVISV